MANAQGEAVAEYMRQYHRAHSTRPTMIPGATREAKTCKKCGGLKSRSDFTIRKVGPRKGHLAAYCKPCASLRSAQFYQQNRQKYPDYYRRVEWPAKLKRLYGITVDDYNAMLSRQGGGCALCGSKSPLPGNRKYKTNSRTVFDVDHCHKTGKVRGLLCTRCNRLVGLANDDAQTARRLADYLSAKEA